MEKGKMRDACLKAVIALGNRIEKAISGSRLECAAYEPFSLQCGPVDMEGGRWRFDAFCGYRTAERMGILPEDARKTILCNAEHEWKCCFEDFVEEWNQDNPDRMIDSRHAYGNARNIHELACDEFDGFGDHFDDFKNTWYEDAGYDFMWRVECCMAGDDAEFMVKYNMNGGEFAEDKERVLYSFGMDGQELAELSRKGRPAWNGFADEIYARMEALAVSREDERWSPHP